MSINLSNGIVLRDTHLELGVGKWAQVHGLIHRARGPRGLRTNFFKRSVIMSYFWARPA